MPASSAGFNASRSIRSNAGTPPWGPVQAASRTLSVATVSVALSMEVVSAQATANIVVAAMAVRSGWFGMGEQASQLAAALQPSEPSLASSYKTSLQGASAGFLTRRSSGKGLSLSGLRPEPHAAARGGPAPHAAPARHARARLGRGCNAVQAGASSGNLYGSTPAAAMTSRIEASVAGELRMFIPRCMPTAMSSGVAPRSFFWFHTAMSAPASASCVTTRGRCL